MKISGIILKSFPVLCNEPLNMDGNFNATGKSFIIDVPIGQGYLAHSNKNPKGFNDVFLTIKGKEYCDSEIKKRMIA